MTLFIDKSKCKINDSLNGFFLEVETDEPIEIRCIGTSSALCDRGALIKEDEE